MAGTGSFLGAKFLTKEELLIELTHYSLLFSIQQKLYIIYVNRSITEVKIINAIIIILLYIPLDLVWSEHTPQSLS